MKKTCLLLLLVPFFALSREDTLLCKKKFNLTFDFNLSIPQRRNFNYILQKPYDQPNGSPGIYLKDHETKTIYDSFILKNALNFSLNAEFCLKKKLYFQTGINIIANFERASYYSDSLYLPNGTWGQEILSKITTYNFLIPVGLQYRFNKNVFGSVGISTNIYSLTKEKDVYYQVYQAGKGKSSSSMIFIFPEAYIASNVRLFPRTYLNLKISYNYLSNNSISDFGLNLYYTMGIKFFII